MTTANLSLHSQRSGSPGGGNTTGELIAGIYFDTWLNSAMRFIPPGDIAGATITSVTLTIYAYSAEAVGGVLIKVGLANNTDDLASQDLGAATSSAYEYLHSPDFPSPPSGSQEVAETISAPDTYTIDLTASAIVANLENDIIVLVQFEDFERLISGDTADYIGFQGLGDSNPPTLEIVYTPAVSSFELEHSSTDDNDSSAAIAEVVTLLTHASTDADDTSLATVFHGIEYTTASATTDANDTSAAVAASSTSASAILTDQDDTTLAAVSVEVIAAHASTDDDDITLAITETFGWFANSQTTDDDDVTASVLSAPNTATSETTDDDDVTLAVAFSSIVSGLSDTTDQNDISLALVSVQAIATLATTDDDDIPSTTATRDTVRKRGFSPSGFRTSNHRSKSFFLGV